MLCLNVQMNWMKSGSNLLFDFVNILESKIFDFSFYHSINQKILSIYRKHAFLLFLRIKMV